MAECRHTDWIELHQGDNGNVQVSNPGRFDRLVKSLDNPYEEYPQLVLCIGEAECALKHAFLGDHSSEYVSSNGFSHLYVADKIGWPCNPIFIASVQPSAQASRNLPELCHPTQRGELRRSKQRDRDGANFQVLTRLLMPFADVVILFSTTLHSAKLDVSRYMRTCQQASNIPRAARPCFLLVTSDSTGGPNSSSLPFPSRHVSARDVDTMLPLALFRGLKDVRQLKEACRFRFSAAQLQWYFEQVREHVTDSSAAFDFIARSRIGRPITAAFAENIAELIGRARKLGIAKDTIHELLSLTIILDAYAPGRIGKAIL